MYQVSAEHLRLPLALAQDRACREGHGRILQLQHSGHLGGLDVRGSGKGVAQGLGPLNQHRCIHRDERVWERNRSRGTAWGCSLLSHAQAWDRESSSVCQHSHEPALLCALGSLGVLVVSLLIPTRPPPGSCPSCPLVLLTITLPVPAAVKDQAGMWT